jgi:F0F1-type ATP synthase membrane subunit a
MTGIGSGEYDPVDIAGYLIDIIVLILQGIRDRASTLGSLTAITLILMLLMGLLSVFVGIPAAFVAAIMAFAYLGKKHKVPKVGSM